MKAEVYLHELKRATSLVAGITRSKIYSQYTDHVVLDFNNNNLTLSATNLSISLRTSLNYKSAEGSGSIAIPAKLLSQIISVARGPVISLVKNMHGNVMHIRDSGGSSFSINCSSTEDWPTIIPDIEGTTISLQAQTLRDIIRWTSFATTDERSRYVLGGVLLDAQGSRCRWVATDGRRLSYIESPLDDNSSVRALIPVQTMREINTALPDDGHVRITLNPKRIFCQTDDTVIASTLLEDNFPPYDKLIREDYQHTITVNSPDLLHAVKCASTITERSNLVTFETMQYGALRISGIQREAGQAVSQISADVGLAHIKAHYNARYLIEFLQTRLKDQQDKLTINYVKGSETAYLIPSCVGFDPLLHIIMPMSVKEAEQAEPENDDQEENTEAEDEDDNQ